MDAKNLITSGSMDITYDCNFRCLHCFNSSGEQQYHKPMLTDEEIIKISGELSKIETMQSFCFCGGEPFLKKNTLFQAAAELKKENKTMTVNSVSNGYLIDEKVAEEIKESALNMIQISVDGHNEKVHNFIRNNNFAYQKAINAIKLLKKNNVTVSVATLPTKLIIDHLDEHIKMMEDLGVYLLRFQPLMFLGRAKNHLSEYALSDSEYRSLARYLLRLESERSNTGRMRIEWGDPIQHMFDFRDKNLIYIDINAYGELIVSPYLPIIVGDLRKHSLNDYFENGLQNIWKSEFVKSLSSKITTWSNMDISMNYDIPEIFTDQIYKFDLVDNDELFRVKLDI